ncbi:hypothetical protein ACK1X7_07455 [Streptomyces sp. CY1]|uniref:hypothetical protein n=1 Tax=Streptomyces sp. CY1 TaxID=3388313 RepID=UPI0039A2D25F
MSERNRSADVPRQKRRTWENTFAKLGEARKKAEEDELIAVYRARRDGLTQADVAYMLGGVAPSGIAAKEAKGRKILLERGERKTADA